MKSIRLIRRRLRSVDGDREGVVVMIGWMLILCAAGQGGALERARYVYGLSF
jgi:hypothetical protein